MFDNKKGRWVDISEYGVFLSIDVVSGITGDVIDVHSEDEFFQRKEEADRVAAEYRSQIGEVVCSWGNDIGILREVYVDDEPRTNQYYATDV